ncbi:MAG: HDOD domain-containing protein [Kofleriaceae bacterium]|nr:HDOD domain-containing protein [Kofleriaceae bacterium]
MLTKDAPALPEPLRQRLEGDPALPSLPACADRLLRLFSKHDEPSPATVADVVQQDAAMAAKVLRHANSAAYAIPQPSRTVLQAVTMIGVRRTRNLVLTFALQGMSSGRGNGMRAFWRRSVYSGVLARELAALPTWGSISAEEAALAALFQDIGALAMLCVLGESYDKMVSRASTNHALLGEDERRLFGADHADVGAWLLARWGLPGYLVEAVALSHGPAEVGSSMPPLPRLVATAGAVADAWVEGRAAEMLHQTGEFAAFPTDDPLKEALARAEARLRESAPLFDVSLFAETRLDWLLSRARELLSQA